MTWERCSCCCCCFCCCHCRCTEPMSSVVVLCIYTVAPVTEAILFWSPCVDLYQSIVLHVILPHALSQIHVYEHACMYSYSWAYSCGSFHETLRYWISYKMLCFVLSGAWPVLTDDFVEFVWQIVSERIYSSTTTATTYEDGVIFRLQEFGSAPRSSDGFCDINSVPSPALSSLSLPVDIDSCVWAFPMHPSFLLFPHLLTRFCYLSSCLGYQYTFWLGEYPAVWRLLFFFIWTRCMLCSGIRREYPNLKMCIDSWLHNTHTHKCTL